MGSPPRFGDHRCPQAEIEQESSGANSLDDGERSESVVCDLNIVYAPVPKPAETAFLFVIGDEHTPKHGLGR